MAAYLNNAWYDAGSGSDDTHARPRPDSASISSDDEEEADNLLQRLNGALARVYSMDACEVPESELRYVLPKQSGEYAADNVIQADSLFAATTVGGPAAVDLDRWSKDDVASWVERIDGCEDLARKFRAEGFDGSDLRTLSDQTLVEFGEPLWRAQKVLSHRDELLTQCALEERVANSFALLAGDRLPWQVAEVRFEQLVRPVKIAEGHFGVVYHTVFTNSLGHSRDVVLKKPKKRAKGAELREELRARCGEMSETMCLAKLASMGKHPNVVSLVGVCRDVPGAEGPCQVLTYHSNGSLSTFLKRHHAELAAEWRQDPLQLFVFLRGIVAGVARVHEADLVHADLKLSNIVVTSERQPRIADFGCARKVSGTWPPGTKLPVAHMPPEFRSRRFGFRSDIWMLGFTLLDVVRGHTVEFCSQGSTVVSLVRKQADAGHSSAQMDVKGVVEQVLDADSAHHEIHFLVDLISKCMSFSESDRPSSAIELLNMLDREIDNLHVKVRSERHEQQRRQTNPVRFEQPEIPENLEEQYQQVGKAKVVMLGESAVGKSSLTLRFVNQQFPEEHTSTIGADFMSKVIPVDHRALKLAIWDTVGQEQFQAITRMYYRGSAAAIIVYDITSTASFERSKKCVADVREHAADGVTIMLLGNKVDLHDKRQVADATGRAYAEEIGALFFEVSAKTADNLDAALAGLASVLVERPDLHWSERRSHAASFQLGSAEEGKKKKRKCC